MEHMALGGYDIFVIMLYMLGIMFMGSYFGKYVRSSGDYFLAGRMLPWWAIGMSLVVSDIGALDFIGVSGQGYQYGIVVANFDWIGCLPPLILAAFIFAPYYWRAGIYTIPEYLGRRYNQWVRLIHAILWGLFLAANLAIMFWATGLMFNEFIPLNDTFMAGIPHAVLGGLPWHYGPNWQIMLWILFIAVVVGVYTISGGLSAVVITDVVQLVIMFVGGLAIIAVGLYQLGGIGPLKETIYALGPEYQNHFKLFLPADSPTPYPWTGIIFGLAFVLAPAYWLGNQAIIQRTLGARSEWDAKAGTLWCGFLHALIPILITVPGLIGLALYHGEVTNSDMAFPHMINKLLPAGMTGLVFAAFMAGLMSSVDSALNSAATIWTKDIWQSYFSKDASDRQLLIMGRILTFVFIIMAVLVAPIVKEFDSIYQAIQNFLTFIQGPSLALLLLGMLWKRTTGWGGLAGILSGLAFSIGMFFIHRHLLDTTGSGLFTQTDPFLFIAWWSFVGSVAVTVIVSLLTPPHSPEKLKGLVYSPSLDSPEAQAALERRAGK
ncbi:MAG TPA: sodium/solute symporter [bacterium]|nr:sodium/solute symporter [bacterium]